MLFIGWLFLDLWNDTKLSIRLQDFCPNRADFFRRTWILFKVFFDWCGQFCITLYFAWKYVDFSGRKFPVKGRKYPARLNMTEKTKTWSGKCFLEMVIFTLKWRNLKKWREIKQKSSLHRNLQPINIQVLKFLKNEKPSSKVQGFRVQHIREPQRRRVFFPPSDSTKSP